MKKGTQIDPKQREQMEPKMKAERSLPKPIGTAMYRHRVSVAFDWLKEKMSVVADASTT